MIWIPLAAIAIMVLFIIVYSKTFLVDTSAGFKVLVGIFGVVNLFFIYWGPHIVKILSGIVYIEDVWYIIAWALLSMIVTLSVIVTKANRIK